MTNETRPLTNEELAAFPGDSFTDCAMISFDGNWYYAESDIGHDDAGETYDMTQFITDEGGDYIPIKTN